jgi:hypothetical protein
MSVPPQLQIADLYKRRTAKDAARLRAYNQILESVYMRIKMQSNMPNSPCDLLYTIPPFILGLPRIDLEDCVVYLVYQLRQNGFIVAYTFPNLLRISWMHHERDYILEQSPIMQAMMANSQTLKEKQHSKSMAAFNKKPKQPKNPHVASGMTKSHHQQPQELSAGKALSAIDYQPPTAFVQQMEKPDVKKNVVITDPKLTGVLADLWR